MNNGQNQFWVSGNLTRNPVRGKTAGGTATCEYTIASSDGKTTSYIPITTYGRQAENDAKYLRMGSEVSVVGRIQSFSRRDSGGTGFNFNASRVVYHGKPDTTPTNNNNPNEDKPPPEGTINGDDHAEWIAAYESAKPGGFRGAQH